MIERGLKKLLAGGGGDRPPLAVTERVSLPCGCAALYGVRLDLGEPAMATVPCGPSHAWFTGLVSEHYKATLACPQDRGAAEVAEELAREYGIEVVDV